MRAETGFAGALIKVVDAVHAFLDANTAKREKQMPEMIELLKHALNMETKTKGVQTELSDKTEQL